MRTIDADALKNALDTFATLVGFRGVYDRGQVMECIDAAPTVATDKNVLGKWISVKDRLPRVLDQVLLYTNDGRMHVGQYNDLFDSFMFANAHLAGRVTHWMPLPEPPEEVSK